MIAYLLTFAAGFVVGGLFVGAGMWATGFPTSRLDRLERRVNELLRRHGG